jgi:dTDP-glucose 4,6-dehydratase
MKYFVTGAAGFIGSNYVRHVLATTDHEVTVYDALTYAGNLSTMKDMSDDPRFSFVQGNICDPAAVETAMKGHEVVVHFAAESHVDRSISGSDDFILTNCYGTNVIVDTARRLEMQRVLHIGTDEVYGSVEEGSSLETDPLEPRSPYSASKAGSDLIALSYYSTHNTPVVVTRCTNNFGPYQYPEKAIPLFVSNWCSKRATSERSTTSVQATKLQIEYLSTRFSTSWAKTNPVSNMLKTVRVMTVATR